MIHVKECGWREDKAGSRGKKERWWMYSRYVSE